ncbi:MAG TPA: DMT family transporter [Polyangiaceae bacterium]|nr:DMT family transporter [Polyangiaceae bacterium]
MSANREQWVGVCYATLSVLLFASFTLFSRLGLATGLRPVDVAALRFTIGGVLLSPVLVRRGFSALRCRDALGLAFCGGFGFAFFAYAGFWLAPAAHGSVLLHGTIPIFTQCLTPSVAGGRRHRRTAATLLIASGVLAMAYDSLAAARGRQLVGDGALLVASLLWSAYGVRARSSKLAPGHAAALVAVLSMACFLPIYALIPHQALFAIGAGQLLLQAAVQGVLVGALSIFVYTRAVASLGPATTSLFTAAVPCLTTLAAIPLLGEIPSIVGLSGVGLVTLGMALGLRSPALVR